MRDVNELKMMRDCFKYCLTQTETSDIQIVDCPRSHEEECGDEKRLKCQRKFIEHIINELDEAIQDAEKDAAAALELSETLSKLFKQLMQ